MSSESSQKVVLYFLELLLNSGKASTISQLTGHFGNSFFTPEMRATAGINERGLRRFLLSYPSIFIIRGNTVFLSNGEEENKEREPGSSRKIPELEVIQFLAQELAKRGKCWVQVQCLTDHFSQMTTEMRPQIQLKQFLFRYPRVFEVSGDLVRLLVSSDSTPIPESLPVISQSSRTLGKAETPGKTDLDKRSTSAEQVAATSSRTSAIKGVGGADLNTPVTMTVTEYSAVILLKNNIEENGSMKVPDLMQFAERQASEDIRNMLGSTKMEFINFLKKHSQIFEIVSEETVGLVKNAHIHVMITRVKNSELQNNDEEEKQLKLMLELDPQAKLQHTTYQRTDKIFLEKENGKWFTKVNSAKSSSKQEHFNDSSILCPPRQTDNCCQQNSSVLGNCKAVASTRTYASIACQTLSTNDIIATQF